MNSLRPISPLHVALGGTGCVCKRVDRGRPKPTAIQPLSIEAPTGPFNLGRARIAQGSARRGRFGPYQ